MKKVTAFFIFLVLLILAAVAYLTTGNRGELIEERVWRGWQGEADKSKYYVITKVLAKNGMTLTTQDNSMLPPSLSEYDALILSVNTVILDDEFVDELERWVRNGGRLLLPAENALAERFTIEYDESIEDESCKDDGSLRWKTSSGMMLNAQTPLSGTIILPKKNALRLGVACDNWLVVVIKAYEQGKIIAFAHDTHLWADTEEYVFPGMSSDIATVPVAQADNAAYLHDLLGDSQRILFIRNNIHKKPAEFKWSLPDEKWWPALMMLAFAILAAVWAFGSRFGPLLLKAQLSSVDIDNHLRAAGRFWEAESGYSWLARAAHQRFETDFNQLARRFGSEEAAIAWLVSQTNLSASQIRNIRLHAALPKNETAFVRFMSILEELRRVL